MICVAIGMDLQEWLASSQQQLRRRCLEERPHLRQIRGGRPRTSNIDGSKQVTRLQSRNVDRLQDGICARVLDHQLELQRRRRRPSGASRCFVYRRPLLAVHAAFDHGQDGA